MNKKQNLFLFLIALIVAITVASFQKAPGYMDADYYFSGGLRLAEGEGFTEMILWNFLDDPQGLPHASHTYWMPLTSIFAYLGIYVLSFLPKYKAAQLGFILISAFIPIITAQISYHFFKDKTKAMFSGLLAIFSGFYLPFITTTDSFAIYMLLGGLFNLILIKLEKPWHYFSLGLIAGLMHMARADGLIWLIVAFLVIWIKRKEIKIIKISSIIFLAYFLVSFPWFLRNWQLYGSLLAQGGGRSLFLLNYDELYSFPASSLNYAHLLSVGIWTVIKTRWVAVLSNLQTAFAVQGLMFLGPLALFSAWKKRNTLSIKLASIAWALTFFIMSILFPFSGARGGFFHSGAVFMPLIWALSSDGLDTFIHWIGKRRSWKIQQAIKVFRVGILVMVIFLSTYLSIQKISTWTDISNSYSKLESHLVSIGANSGDIVLVNNPPSYYATTNRAAIVIPNGGLQKIDELNKIYQAQYLLLEVNHPESLDFLYRNPQSLSGLEYLETVWDYEKGYREDYLGTHLFKVDP